MQVVKHKKANVCGREEKKIHWLLFLYKKKVYCNIFEAMKSMRKGVDLIMPMCSNYILIYLLSYCSTEAWIRRKKKTNINDTFMTSNLDVRVWVSGTHACVNIFVCPYETFGLLAQHTHKSTSTFSIKGKIY